MRLLLLCLALLPLLALGVQGITVEEGVRFANGYEYIKVETDTYSKIDLNASEFFLDGIEYCDSTVQKDFTSNRPCLKEAAKDGVNEGFSAFIGIVALLSGIAVLITFIGIMLGAEVNYAFFGAFVLVFVLALLALGVASLVVGT